MKKWYFDLPEFKAETGFDFSFVGGPPNGIQYLHLCEVIEVIPERKLTYSWRYEGYAGKSYVTFELFPEQEKTRLLLTHKEIETFPPENADFHQKNFVEGWNQIIKGSLKKYIED